MSNKHIVTVYSAETLADMRQHVRSMGYDPVFPVRKHALLVYTLDPLDPAEMVLHKLYVRRKQDGTYQYRIKWNANLKYHAFRPKPKKVY